MPLPLHTSKTLVIYSALTEIVLERPLISEGISAGFPSPALDFEQPVIDLNKELIKDPTSTYYARVKGNSMKDAGIDNGDLLVVDKSIEDINGQIAVCFIEGEFTLKRIKLTKDECWLMPENKDYKPIKVSLEDEFTVWGIVTQIIKKPKKCLL